MLDPYFQESGTSNPEAEIQVGVDEVGRGCLAGPVCAAAVVLNVPKIKELEAKGDTRLSLIKDSKKVTKKQRESLVAFIREICLACSVSMVDNHEIDRLNILQATMKAMHLAIDDVINGLSTPSHKVDRIIVDGTYFKPYLNKGYLQQQVDNKELKELNEQHMYIPHHTVINGDNTYLSIAAASILAKTTRDEYMSSICDGRYDWKNNKGYGTPKHLQGLYTHGPSLYHRKSFKYPKQRSTGKDDARK